MRAMWPAVLTSSFLVFRSVQAEAESVEGGGPTVTEADIANITAQWTGIPIEKVGKGHSCYMSLIANINAQWTSIPIGKVGKGHSCA